jgi:hypothetical protein
MTHKGITKRKTWLNLYDFFATNHHIPIDFWYDKDQPGGPYHNSHFEPITNRRFNQVSRDRRDPKKVRLAFLRSLLVEQPGYKRLCHKDGRPVWAHNLRYEGTSAQNHRLLSFNLAGETKVFTVSEKHVLFLEDDQYINPNHQFFMLSHRLAFSCFGNPFVAERCLDIMYENKDSDETKEDFLSRVAADADVKVGSLVEVRMGLFAPDFKYRKTLLATMAEKYCRNQQLDERHPSRTNLFKSLKGASAFHGITENQEPAYVEFINWCRESTECDFPLGLVLRKDTVSQNFFSNGKETFAVKFGDLVYEEIHPIQLEVVKNNV